MKKFIYLALIGALLIVGCVRPRPNPPPPPPPPPYSVVVQITVRDNAGNPLLDAVGKLTPDGQETTPCTNVDGRLNCRTSATGGATLEISAPGYVTRKIHIALDPDQTDLELQKEAPPLARLRAEGKFMRRADGVPFVWQGITSFRLAEFIHVGREAEVDAFLAWAAEHDVTVVRVFSTAGSCCNPQGQPYLFRLEPAAGRAAVPRVLQLAANHGLYVEVVALVDTKYHNYDLRQHVADLGQTCKVYVSCILQLANEPAHGTQLGQVADPTFLQELSRLVPEEVPLTYGAAHGSEDWRYDWAGGEFVTVHFDRADGEDHFTNDGRGLRWVRHIKDGLDAAEALNKYVVNDEPRRNDLTPWKHAAVAIICRMLGLGDTFHYGGGLQSTIPEGAELVAFEARRRGWTSIPRDWEGRFYNVGHAGSMVSAADWNTTLKVFSAARGDEAYTVSIGSGEPSFTWTWPNRELLLAEGGLLLWRVTR